MTNDDVIRMWREAGFQTTPAGAALEKLMRFTCVVANAERAALLPVLIECHEAMEYMSDYDIPIGLPERVKKAVQSRAKA